MYESQSIISFIFQVYGQRVNEHPTSTTVRHSILNTENEDVPINLELSVQRDRSETPSVG